MSSGEGRDISSSTSVVDRVSESSEALGEWVSMLSFDLDGISPSSSLHSATAWLVSGEGESAARVR